MSISRRSFLAASAAGVIGGLASNASAQSQVALRVSSSMPADSNAAHYAWFEAFRSRLQASVGDRIRLDYFPNSQLGKESDVVQQVRVGSIDMMLTGSSIWATAVPELGMLDLGYMFDSFDHVARALDAGAGNALSKILKDRTGVTNLGWGFSFGARNVYSKTPITSLVEMRAVKLRVLPTPAFIQTFKIMGAIPTPIPVNELYTALQTGVVDGFEHDAGTVLAQKFYEVTKHGFLTEHLFSPLTATIGRRGLDKVKDDLRPAFLKAAAEATQAQRIVAVKAAAYALEELKRLGVSFSPLAAAERRDLQRQMAEQLYAPFGQQYPPTKPIFDAVAATRSA